MTKRLTELFDSESLAYFERNYGTTDLTTLDLHPYLATLFDAGQPDLEGGACLEIGCAAANNLVGLRSRLGLIRCVGTEPSAAVVRTLTATFPDMEFVASNSLALPFETGTFDVVLIRSVLHWVEREAVLQVLGEALRVASRYLVVSDFAPRQPYSTEYHHQPGYRTFKQRLAPLLVATGQVELVTLVTHSDDDEWERCQTGLYRKLPIDEAFPLRKQSDFA